MIYFEANKSFKPALVKIILESVLSKYDPKEQSIEDLRGLIFDTLYTNLKFDFKVSEIKLVGNSYLGQITLPEDDPEKRVKVINFCLETTPNIKFVEGEK